MVLDCHTIFDGILKYNFHMANVDILSVVGEFRW